jgi:hypothetical protein
MGNLKEMLVSGLKLGLKILVSLLPYIGAIIIAIVVGLIFKNTAIGVFTFVGIFGIFIIYIWIRTSIQKIKEKRNKPV